MTKARELLKGYEIHKLGSSGVTVKILPFPARLYEDIQAEALKEFPEVEVPLKTIKVLDGTEEVENPTDPGYVEQKRARDRERKTWTSEKLLTYLLDFCIQVDLKKWEKVMRRLEKALVPFSKDSDERRVEFLTRYAIVTKSEYEMLLIKSLAQTYIDNPEVAARLETFQREVERAADIDADASGADGDERLDVQPEVEAT